MEEMIKILLSALVGFSFGIGSYNYKFKKELTVNRRKERLTKLLLPLYTKLKHMDNMWNVSIVSDNYTPPDYLDDLPSNLKPLVTIINSNLHLADPKFIRAALEFINWCEVSSVDSKRWDKIMGNKLAKTDKPLIKFTKVVYKAFEKEHEEFLNL